MPFDGSGNYTPPTAPAFPAVTGQTIVAAYYNSVINDLATALNDCVTRDGQGKPSASINWNGQKITNLANGVNPADAINLSQLGGYALLASSPTFTGVITGASLTINNSHLIYSIDASNIGIRVGTAGTFAKFYNNPSLSGSFGIDASSGGPLLLSTGGTAQLTLNTNGSAVFAGAVSGITTLVMAGALSGVTAFTASGALTTGTAPNCVGYLGLPQATVHNANYTFGLADASIDQAFSGTGLTGTIPANATVAFPVGTILVGTNLNASSLTIAITTDTLIWSGTTTTGSRTIGQNGEFRARKVLPTTWLITGTAMS